MPAKLVVKKYRNGSRITLVGPSGKGLLASGVFTEPRAKGATLRSLKSLLGEQVAVEDHTTTATTVKSAPNKGPMASVAAGKADKAVVAQVAPKPRARKASARTSRATK